MASDKEQREGVVEFIAGHKLQAICAESVFQELSKTVRCVWRIGRRLPYRGAKAVVLIDHTSNHPKLRRSWWGHRRLFYMLHDLGDVNVYEREKKRLNKFDVVFVPNKLHEELAKRNLEKRVKIKEVGWPKHDELSLSVEHERALEKVKSLPEDVPTVMHASTVAEAGEWDRLWVVLKELPCNVVIKNATYDVAPGQNIPPHYRRMLKVADRMEKESLARELGNIVVAPRDMNICTLFPYIDVLISARGSVLAEFLPFGLSVELDVPDPVEIPGVLIGKQYKDVVFMKEEELYKQLESLELLNKLISRYKGRPRQVEAVCRYPNDDVSSGEITAGYIRACIEGI